MMVSGSSGPDDPYTLITAPRKGDKSSHHHSSPRLRIGNMACIRGIVVMAFTGLPISLNGDNIPSSPLRNISKNDPEKSVVVGGGDGGHDDEGGFNDTMLNGLSPSFIERFQYQSKFWISGGKRTPSITEDLLYCTRGDTMVKQGRGGRYHSSRKKNKRPRKEVTDGEREVNERSQPFDIQHRKMIKMSGDDDSNNFPGIQHYTMSPKDLLHNGFPCIPESYTVSVTPPPAPPDSTFTNY